MKKTGHYVICIRTEGSEDLEVRKLYRILPDESAASLGHVRIIDESGEDYLYPADWFLPVAVSEEVERALTSESTDSNTIAR